MATLTFEADEQFAETLKALANGGSQATVIQNAVATYKFLKDEITKGSNIALTNGAGAVTDTVSIP